ncbi:MAG: two component sigma54 specific transcriptional regulator Fis family [Chitinophagaceae bacterium]|nr:MAG: two component sigma54 specific transcriptional regulator Fis family [Chitinophagaceae bacterium]
MHTILIVDEDINMCILLEKFFSKNNFTAKYVHSTSKALKKIDEFNPSIIVIDYSLLDVNGKNLLLQFQEINKQVQVIVISSYKDVKHAVGVIKQGAYDYMVKPLFPEEILMTESIVLY